MNSLRIFIFSAYVVLHGASKQISHKEEKTAVSDNEYLRTSEIVTTFATSIIIDRCRTSNSSITNLWDRNN